MTRHPLLTAAVVTVAAVALPSAQPQDKPKVIPSFSTNAAPAFWVECRNLTNRDISLAGAVGRWRIDGVEPPLAGTGGSLPPTQIAPGGTYRGIMALIQPPSGGSGGFSAVLGAMSTLTTQHALTSGRHTLAVQCLGAWSDDFEFYWFPSR